MIRGPCCGFDEGDRRGRRGVWIVLGAGEGSGHGDGESGQRSCGKQQCSG